MGKKHAAGGGGWFATVTKVFQPLSASSASGTTSSKDKDKDPLQHGKQVGAPHPPMQFTILPSTTRDELRS